MPYVKKSEYEKLKMFEVVNELNIKEWAKLKKHNETWADVRKKEQDRLGAENLVLQGEIHSLRHRVDLLKLDIESYRNTREILYKSCVGLNWEVERWKRYYNAAIKTFKIQEYIEMPGCFNPMESIEYIVKQQADEHERLEKEVQNRQAYYEARCI